MIRIRQIFIDIEKDNEEYSSRYFLETILFTLDNIKNSLKEQINELYSIEFDTKMNEYYQTPKLKKHTTEIIPFYRKNLIDDAYVFSDASISDVFNKKPKNILKLVKDDYNSTENHNEWC